MNLLPKRQTNKSVRSREHLTEQEITRMIDSVPETSRTYSRDRLLMLTLFIHGLRVSEAANLKWDQIDFDNKTMYVSRLKKGDDSTHPIPKKELDQLIDMRRVFPDSIFIFLSLSGFKNMSIRAILNVVNLYGKLSGLTFPVHTHMFRHSTGYHFAKQGIDTRAIQAYLGHRNIQHTVRYTALSPDRFNGFWDK